MESNVFKSPNLLHVILRNCSEFHRIRILQSEYSHLRQKLVLCRGNGKCKELGLYKKKERKKREVYEFYEFFNEFYEFAKNTYSGSK